MTIEPGIALAWYRQFLAELDGDRPRKLIGAEDPSKAEEIDSQLRLLFSEYAPRRYKIDPLGNIRDWHDFLAKKVSLN